MKKINIAIILMAIFAFVSTIKAYSGTVNFSADYVDYDENTNSIYARGNVKIEYEGLEIFSNEIFFKTETKQLNAKGDVVLKSKEGTYFGEDVDYNLESKSGKIGNARLTNPPWFCGGPEIEKIGPDKIVIHRGFFTSCDLLVPHYRLKAKKIIIYPEKKIIAKQVLLYVGNIPVFYLPWYTQSLKKDKLKIDVRVGHNSNEGDFMKVKLGYPLSLYTHSKLYLDFMSNKGVGTGVEFDYDVPDTMIGSLYNYYIKEKDTKTERWNSRLAHWQKISNYLTGRANLNFMSDRLFNDLYKFSDTPSESSPAQDEFFNTNYNETRVTEELKSSLALTATADDYQATIVGERKDSWDEPSDAFKKDYVQAPNFNFSFFPHRLASIKVRRREVPLYYKFNLNTQNYYTKEKGEYIFSTNGNFGLITNGFFINRYLILTPEINFQQAVDDKYYSNMYNTQTKLRIRPVRWIDNDITYIARDTLYKQGDLTSIPPVSKIANMDILNVNSYTKFILSTGYNFRGTLKDEWDDFIGELQFRSPEDKYYLKKIYFREIYSIEKGKNQSVQLELLWAKTDKWYVRKKWNYLIYDPDVADVNLGAGIWLFNKKWKLEGNIRFDIFYKELASSNNKAVEQELVLWKDMHCWEGIISWKKRLKEQEIWLMLNLKVFPERKIGVHHNVQQNEWDFRTKRNDIGQILP